MTGNPQACLFLLTLLKLRSLLFNQIDESCGGKAKAARQKEYGVQRWPEFALLKLKQVNPVNGRKVGKFLLGISRLFAQPADHPHKRIR